MEYNRKFCILRDDCKIVDGIRVYRIKATSNVNSYVKYGDLGGFIQKKSNLEISGESWVFEDAVVMGDAVVTDAARIYGNAKICENAIVYDNCVIGDNVICRGNSVICGNSAIYGNVRFLWRRRGGSDAQ